MNVQPKRNSLVPETVTTGPLTGSRKVYATPTGWDDVHVPLREILLSDPAEPELYVYDASGPYTEVDARIDLAKGLPRVREPWIARRGFKPYQGRPIKAEDNGDAAGDKLVPACPANTNSAANANNASAASPAAQSSAADTSGQRRRLNFKEQREFDGMEAAVEAAERAHALAEARVGEPGIAANHAKMAAACQALEVAQLAVTTLYARWQELESKRGG